MASTQIYTKTLSNGERELLEETLAGITYPENGYAEYLAQLRKARDRVAGMFSDLSALADLGRSPPVFCGALKVGNLPTSANVPVPPPQAGLAKRIEKPSYLSENLLTMIASFFGEPYSMYCEGRGLVNNLVPSRETSGDLSGLGTTSELRLHIENAALRFMTGRDCSPKALFLTGVRQDASPPYTRVSDARLALSMLSPEERAALASPAYQMKLPYRWRRSRGAYANVTTRPIPLVERTPAGLVVNAAFYGDMIADILSPRAERAAKRFEAALEEVAIDEIVSPGELLGIDNRVTLHARTAFKASFDEQGRASRWVQRIFVTDALENFDGWERIDDAVFAPTFTVEQPTSRPTAQLHG
ncbi:TauD/TfdA family dioxygenase [Sorangium sp. So ce185]|uniref:TauD/TfdA family dioxygenase n=1 Tax=Sorangium sp. So ce185 TaxID=3133287 RepID=UPI003F611463